MSNGFDAPDHDVAQINRVTDGRAFACPGAFACPTSGAGKLGSALVFDGVDDYVSLGNPDALNFGGNITLEAWIRPESTGQTQNIIAHGFQDNPDPAEVYLRISGGEYQVGTWLGIDFGAHANVDPADIGRWVHLAGVYDGSAWRLYKNGVEVASSVGIGAAMVSNEPWAIGARGAVPSNRAAYSVEGAAAVRDSTTSGAPTYRRNGSGCVAQSRYPSDRAKRLKSCLVAS